MRHQNQPAEDQATRLLMIKDKPYAELDENSRIAISILSGDGWKFSRVGLDMRVEVTVTSNPMIEEHDAAQLANAKLVQHLADAELRFVALRARVIEAGAQQWLMAMFAFFTAAMVDALGAGRWTGCLVPVCLVCYFIARRAGKKGTA
jgi:hypothetical protein